MRTGEVSDPGDLRRHDLSHAVCIPGFTPASAAPPALADAAALASKVDNLIKALKTAAADAAVVAALNLNFPNISGPATPDVAFTTGSDVLKLGS